ncbi:hypothetical protein Csa_019338 [Cucumis sativus]|nr:hypothetical protein Csa_019338 [Cucumis sativus]
MANWTTILFLLVAAAFCRSSSAATYTVGDALGWTVPPNPTVYSDWASTKTFVVGDILVFNFASGRHDVTEVTKSASDSCNSTNPISVANNSPARITLTSAGDRHFICSFPGHCSNGQTLSITVTSTSSSPAPQPSSRPSPSPVPVPVPSPSPSARSPSPSPSSTPSSSPVPSPTPSREPMTYIVGDSFGWNVPTSPTFYDSWAQGKTFVVGDVLALAAAMATTSTASTTYKVGDDQGWKVPKDDPAHYMAWPVNKTFTVGDKLGCISNLKLMKGTRILQKEFTWTGTHNVAEVTKEEYTRCVEVKTVHEFSPVTISLDTPGPKYFICAVVPHCSFGQRLTIVVEPDSSTTPPAPEPTPSSAPSSLLANSLYAAMLTIVSMFFTRL